MMTPEQIAAMQYETIDAQAKDIKKRDLIIKNQAAEIERLKSCIPWRDGPPPEEWRDGRQVLVWINGRGVVAQWGDELEWQSEPTWFGDDDITHHAAITKPGETL